MSENSPTVLKGSKRNKKKSYGSVCLLAVPYALAGDTTRIQFDAFVCYSIEDPLDRQFVRDLIEILELQERLKLFVPGRDDMPGGAQNTINAFIIEKR